MSKVICQITRPPITAKILTSPQKYTVYEALYNYLDNPRCIIFRKTAGPYHPPLKLKKKKLLRYVHEEN